MTLNERIVALHRALDEHDLPHAVGGAIALAYWTLNPRGTSDIDVNVFVPAEEAERVLAALPAGVEVPADAAKRIVRDGQIRLWWDGTPLDLFLDNAPVHADAAAHREIVEFEGVQIPVLGAGELAVFKAMFDRPQDWVDIGSMIAAGTLDLAAVRAALVAMVGADDQRVGKLDALA